MTRYDSKDPDFTAWVEVPDEWLSGDFDLYTRTYQATRAAGHTHPTARLAGVLALALKGRIKCEVPGIVFVPGEEPDLKGITAKAEGFLIGAVAVPLELTQYVPFGLSEPSENGSTAPKSKRKAKKDQ